MNRRWLASLGIFIAELSFGQTNATPLGPSPQVEEQMIQHNRRLALNYRRTFKYQPEMKTNQAYRPFSEIERAGYLIMSGDMNFDSQIAKVAMLKNLPTDAHAIVYYDTDCGSYCRKNLNDLFAPVIESQRLHLIAVPNASSGFWARDGIPVPLVEKKDNASSETLGLVDARYYHHFEPDRLFSEMFLAPLFTNTYSFEGGNFIVNDKGDCIVINNSRVQFIPDSIFTQTYACKTLYRLPHLKGIGHADESVRFVNRGELLTDTLQYKETLETAGFKVHMLPRPQGQFETYVNSLLINGTIFVPIFNEKTDDDAIRVYEELGLNVVPLETNELSNSGRGSLHCITMTYPPVAFSKIKSLLENF